MRLFKCQACGQIVHFENTLCEKCGHRLAYLAAATTVTAIEPEGPEGDNTWKALAAPGKLFRLCENAAHGSCNWLIEADAPGTLCLCCRHNRIIPDISLEENAEKWRKIEWAKHRLFYSLLRLKLPLVTKLEQQETGLAFDFLADALEPTGPRVMTGHDNGLITIALKEADDAEREKSRVAMHEPYRTLLGHFRHEIGHYYWDRLVRDGGKLDACRQQFGDDTLDYGQALQRHYEQGAPPDWRTSFVTAYATMHPWEDFAETWAHYMHLIDTLETAAAFGLSTRPRVAEGDELDAKVDFDPYRAQPFDRLVESWMPLTIALNSLNRSMGQPDLYPFVLSTPALEKLAFVHGLVHPDMPA
ncbi:MAG: putative zinc-binding peptidase [Enhydrobacter sp.]|nr:putative zinc-binding peptidase [Enhydrobacter sp.]